MKKVRKKDPPDSKGLNLHSLCAVLPEKLRHHGFGHWLDSSHAVACSILCKLGLLSVTYNRIPDSQQSRAKVSVKIFWPFLPCHKVAFATLNIKSTFQDKRKGEEGTMSTDVCLHPIGQDHATCSPLAAREPEKVVFHFPVSVVGNVREKGSEIRYWVSWWHLSHQPSGKKILIRIRKCDSAY